MRKLIVLTLAATLLIGIGATTPAPAEPAGLSVAKPHKKKRKAVKCRKSQVKIKVNRRTVGCRPLRASLRPPRAGDPRLLLAKAALDDDLRRLRDRRGRRAPSLKRLFRKVGPRAYRTVQRAVPQGLARLDRMAATVPKVARSAAASQLPRCANGTGPPTTDTYGSRSGGQKMTATLTLGAVGTFDLRLEDGGYRISVRITTDECSHFDAPDCPTAAGVLDATDSSTNKVSLGVAKGDTVLMSQSFAFTGTTRMHAEVDADAKLDLIDIDHTQTANIELGGSRQQFGPVNLIYTGLHHARVDMPSGKYVPDLSAVDISLTTRGVTSGRSSLGEVGNNIAKDLDKTFAALVATEIANYRRLETAWNVPNTCVKVQFSPASRRLKLRRGQQGSVSAQAVAVQGGGVAHGRWTRTEQQNATFNPERLEGTEPRFSYRVTKAGRNILVTATVSVTSKAGVGKGGWTQETDSEELPLYVGEVSGTVTENGDGGDCPDDHGEWSYSASLQGFEGQPFDVGQDGGAYPYNESGSGQYVLPPCPDIASPGCSTALVRDPDGVPGSVLFWVDGDSVEAEVTTFSYTGWACGVNPGGLLGKGRFPLSLVGARTITVNLSYREDRTYHQRVGQGTLTMHRVN